MEYINELMKEESTGIWTACEEDNCSHHNSINRFRRLKSLNYFLFNSLADKPYELWPISGRRLILKQNQGGDQDDYKKCICGHKIYDYAIVESLQNDRVYIGMCCIKKFDEGWNKEIREGMKKCPCGKKKIMTDLHCKDCRHCVKCNIIKPMKRLYDDQCITCSEEAETRQREKIRMDQLAAEKAKEDLRKKTERQRIEYITKLKEANSYAQNEWEKNFTSDLIKKIIGYKNPYKLSDKQQNCLEKILNRGRERERQ